MGKDLHPRVITIAFAIGYFAFYLCRVGLSVVRPVWLSELELAGVSKSDALRMVGNIVSLGMLAAALGLAKATVSIAARLTLFAVLQFTVNNQ